ncbi:MAG: hypothetical protein KAI98_08905, partial [Gemmatimonadetes bacterium]|nr:hypothetical protein [Gemmatimonadota bacterium]
MTGPSTDDPRDLARELLRAVREIGAPDGFEPELSRPRDTAHGDWASNVALVLAKQLGEPPRVLA